MVSASLGWGRACAPQLMQDQYWSCINVSEAVIAAGQGRRAPAFMPDQLWSGINAGGPGVHIPYVVRMELEWLYYNYFLSPNIEIYIYMNILYLEKDNRKCKYTTPFVEGDEAERTPPPRYALPVY